MSLDRMPSSVVNVFIYSFVRHNECGNALCSDRCDDKLIVSICFAILGIFFRNDAVANVHEWKIPNSHWN